MELISSLEWFYTDEFFAFWKFKQQLFDSFMFLLMVLFIYLKFSQPYKKKDDSQWALRIIFKDYYKRNGFVKESHYLSMKLLKEKFFLLVTKLIE